jgi:hypothetical protein
MGECQESIIEIIDYNGEQWSPMNFSHNRPKGEQYIRL